MELWNFEKLQGNAIYISFIFDKYIHIARIDYISGNF